MQFIGMDCSGRSNNAERDSDLGDIESHDDHSDEENRDCDSIDGDRITGRSLVGRLNSSMQSNGGDMSYGNVGGSGGGGGLGVRSPDHQADMQMSHQQHPHHHHQFPPNHPLNALGNFIGIGGLHGMPSLQHNDVLEKLKMQVRDMKVGLMEQDYAAAHAAFGANVLPTPINTAFTLPPTSMASFGHAAAAQNMSVAAANSVANGGGNINAQNSTNSTTSALTNGGGGGGSGGGGVNSFSFTSPTAPNSKDVNPASNSSTSSEASNSSQQNNGWSFEEQYKQVRQLYEINDDPKRKEFLDDLFSFMQKRGSPINRLPIMAKSVLDLFELYNLVIARGGLVDVINKKLWQEIIKGLHLPSSITSAAFTLRTQYMKYLYPYECEKKNLSTPTELQSAIDGNRREGRRSSYGQYEAMHNQMQMPQMPRQSMPGGLQQMSPLALVTHAANSQQAQAVAAAAAAHHRLMAPSFSQVPNIVTQEIEQRMIEYLKIIQAKKDQQQQQQQQQQHQQQQQQQQNAINGGSALVQQQLQRSPSPEISKRDALNALEMSRLTLWQMYHNNTSPPASVNTSPQGGGGGAAGAGICANGVVEPQCSEALNLSDSTPNLTTIKREHDRDPSPLPCESDDFHHQPPPRKRLNSSAASVNNGGNIMSNFPASFYLPHAAAVAAAANFHHAASAAAANAESDGDDNEEHEEEEEEDGEHNITGNSSHDDNDRQHLQLNGGGGHGIDSHHRHHNHSGASINHDKSDDSAIENSPSTSSAGNGHHHTSPVSTKKILLSKQQYNNCSSDAAKSPTTSTAVTAVHAARASISPLETLSLLSGLQFHVAHNGTGANGEPQLMVSLELNGIKYSGVLMANAMTTAAVAAISAVTHNNSINSTIESDENDKVHEEIDDETEINTSDELAETESTTPKLVINGTSSVAAASTLKDEMIAS